MIPAPRSPKRWPIRESDLQALAVAVWVWEWLITTVAAGLCFLAGFLALFVYDAARGIGLAVLGFLIRLFRPSPTAELDDWTGRGR